MGRCVLGIDGGIASAGYGVIDIDKMEFVEYGVHIFNEAHAANNKNVRSIEEQED